MNINSMLDHLLLSNPFYRGMLELLLLIATGISGWAFAWPKFALFPITTILGGLIILVALVFHGRSEKAHKQAHETFDNLDAVVTSGAYARIRHPLYLSLIVLNLGIALAFGVWLTLLVGGLIAEGCIVALGGYDKALNLMAGVAVYDLVFKATVLGICWIFVREQPQMLSEDYVRRITTQRRIPCTEEVLSWSS
jgi:hypothetical protein